MADKFLYIEEGDNEGTILAQDGGVAIIWNNGEHLVGQCYRERLEAEHIKVGYAHAFEEMCDGSSNSSLFDFEGHDNVLPSHIEDMADWLVCPREGEFLENLTYIEADKITKEELDKIVQEFLKDVE